MEDDDLITFTIIDEEHSCISRSSHLPNTVIFEYVIDDIEGIFKISFFDHNNDFLTPTDQDINDLKHHLDMFIHWPEAKELLKTFEDNGRIFFDLDINPSLKKKSAEGESFGFKYVSVASVDCITSDVLYHELLHEYRKQLNPCITYIGSYTNPYAFFKRSFLTEAEARLKGSYFDMNHQCISAEAKKMHSMYQSLLPLKKSAAQLKKEVFCWYFHFHMIGAPTCPEYWQISYKNDYKEWIDEHSEGFIRSSFSPHGFSETASFFNDMANSLGFKEPEMQEIVRCAVDVNHYFCTQQKKIPHLPNDYIKLLDASEELANQELTSLSTAIAQRQQQNQKKEKAEKTQQPKKWKAVPHCHDTYGR